MAAVTAGVLAVGAVAAGAQGARASRKAASKARRAQSQAQLTPFNFFGPGGMTAGFGTQTVGSPTPAVQPGVPRGTVPGGLFVDPNTGAVIDLSRFAPGGQAQNAPADDQRFVNAPGFNRDQREGQDINIDLGDIDPIRTAFRNSIPGNIADGNQLVATDIFSGNPRVPVAPTNFLTNEFNTANASATIPGVNGDVLAQLRGQAVGLAGDNFGPNPLQQAFAGAAQTELDAATQGFDATAQQQLELLRQSARPGEERAANTVANRLFASGRLGTTGGAQIFGELARSQEQADIQRQLSSFNFARQLQNDAFGRSQSFANVQEQLAGGGFSRGLSAAGFGANLDDSLFARQGSIADRLNQLGEQRFGRAANIFDAFQNAGQQRFANQFGLQQFQTGLGERNLARRTDERNNAFSRSLAGLDAIGTTQQMGLNNFNAALNAAIARANAAGTVATNLADIRQAQGAQQAQLFGGISSGLLKGATSLAGGV